MEKEIANLQKEIATANKLLAETSKDKQMTVGQVSLLDKKIRQREKLIKAYNARVAELDGAISKGHGNIKTLNGNLQKLQQEYAQMITFAYRNRSDYNLLMFMFSADDFNQAFRRLRYIQQFSDARKTKMEQISSTQKNINQQVEQSKKEKDEQLALLKDEKEQQKALQQEKEQLKSQINLLKKKEKNIQQSIKDKEAQASRLQKVIEDIIAEEIRRSKQANGTNKEDKLMALTPAEMQLSSTFSANKGKLPWPVERGVIASSFGKHAHPVSEKVIINNNGIDIATQEQSTARAVFDGVVVSVNKITATNNAVIIRHGAYFTVYSNMDEVYVKRGDEVKTKQKIGRVHTDSSEGKTELHFELWQEKTRNDPALWLSR